MKRNVKTLVAAILAALLLVALTACAGGETRPIRTDSTAESRVSDGGSAKPAAKTTAAETEATPAQTVAIDEQVCVEYDGLKVTAKKMVDDSFWGIGIQFLAENNSGKDYTVSTQAVVVNNCMTGAYFSCDVAAGKKANDTLYLDSDDLEAAGIRNIGQIEIYFCIYEDGKYTDAYTPDCVTIRTSQYDAMDTTADDAGKLLYADNGIRIIGKYVHEDPFWGSSVVLLIENNSAQNIRVTCDDLSVNGFMVSEYFYAVVYAGKYALDSITLSDSDLEENGIESVQDIELKFNIADNDSYKSIAKTDAIAFTVD